jgi:hypothetical protein
VVAELFTSEGCSSCPPADAVLTSLVDEGVNGIRVLGLSEHVDYWDSLGWRDPYSSRVFTARQSDYARARRSDRIYTPQIVIDGQFEAVGSSRRGVRRAVAAAARVPKATVGVHAARSTEGSLVHLTIDVAVPPQVRLRDPAALFVAVAEDGLSNDVRAGENRGRHLDHTGVVRSLQRMTTIPLRPEHWSYDTSLPLDPEWKAGELKVIAFVQEEESRRIVGAGWAAAEPAAAPPLPAP